LEQVIIRGQGCKLLSARELQEEIEATRAAIMDEIQKKKESGKNYLFDHMNPEMAKHMDKVRLGKATVEEYEG
jgi:predicted RNA-binding protein with PIN domain